MVKNVALLFACLRSGGTYQRFKVERKHTLENIDLCFYI